MGIKNLIPLLKKFCPSSLRPLDLLSLSNQALTCDASITMYQFLFSTVSLTKKNEIVQPLDPKGSSSAHIMGLIYRSLFLLESKIKPIWVFDGNPPHEKTDILVERMNRMNEAEELMNNSIESADFINAFKYKVQSLRITEEMKKDGENVIKYLGIPYIISPGEAEAQCAYIANMKEMYGTISEDSDCLVFGSKKLIKGLNSKENSKKKAVEIDLEEVLVKLGLNMKEFVDLCILCGNDYNDNITNIGALGAYKFIRKYHNIETIIEEEIVEKKGKTGRNYQIPDNFNYKKVRELFVNPKIKRISYEEIQWKKPDLEGLECYLIKEKGFSAKRTENIVKRFNVLKN